MEFWLILTLTGAFLQNLRSLMQKRLTSDLSINGAAYTRFCFAVPFAWLYLLMLWPERAVQINSTFIFWVLLGGSAQIFATSALVAAVSGRYFAVGTAYSKTEAAQAAILGTILIQDNITWLAALGIVISLLGVFVLTGNRRIGDFFHNDVSLWYGLAAGAAFALCSVCFRAAALSLPFPDDAERGAVTLAYTLTWQTLAMGVFILWRDPQQLLIMARRWPTALSVGVVGMVSSTAWFTAMAIQNAAIVRAVSQVELLFTVLTSAFFLREAISFRQIVGMALIVLGVLAVI